MQELDACRNEFYLQAHNLCCLYYAAHRWWGVTCCSESPLLVGCQQANSVALLDVNGFGLLGNITTDLSALRELSVLVSTSKD
jgi:hypothetical protein